MPAAPSPDDLATPTPEFAAYLRANPPETPSDPLPSYQTERAGLDAAIADEFAALPPPDASQITITDVQIPVDGGKASIKGRLYQPANAPPQRPLAVWFHAGGWYLGNLLQVEAEARWLCPATQTVILAVDYRLAPEHPFPIPLDDCVAGVHFAVAHAAKWGADATKVFTVGESAGGNLAAAVALRDADSGHPVVKGVVGLCMESCHPSYVPARYKDRYRSMSECGEAPLLTAVEMMRCWELYFTRKEDESSPYVSVLLHKLENGHPPMYFQVAGLDPVRDDPICYADHLKEHGVDVKMDVFKGLPHLWWNVPELVEANKAHREKLIQGVQWLVGLMK